MRNWFQIFSLPCKEKNIKFMLASLKTLTNSKDCSESRINFCSGFGFPSLSIVDFLQCTFMAGIRNNFEDHKRLSEPFSKSQAAIGKPEQAS
jgi:hypothetical protein